MDVVVVGAGVAGLACARVLSEAGVAVRVYERSAAPGGRLGSTEWDGRPVDLGAAYLTATSPEFTAQVAAWHRSGLLRPWHGDFTVYGSASPSTTRSPPVRWAAPAGLGSLGSSLAVGLDVTFGFAVKDLTVFGESTVVLAHPSASHNWQPSLAVALRYPSRCWKPLTGAFVNEHPILTTVCDDGSRRGDGAPVLVAHTTPEYAIESAAGDVEAAVRELLDLPSAASARIVRRWPFARPLNPSSSEFSQLDGVFLCGDAYGRPRVETAWRSGRAVASAILRGEVGKTARTGGRPR